MAASEERQNHALVVRFRVEAKQSPQRGGQPGQGPQVTKPLIIIEAMTLDKQHQLMWAEAYCTIPARSGASTRQTTPAVSNSTRTFPFRSCPSVRCNRNEPKPVRFGVLTGG